jgi:hypothetical protein
LKAHVVVCACLTLNTQALPGITDCVAASGTDYQVGPNNGQLASLDLVPWENLEAGDTVRIFYKSEPYRGKMLLTGNGTPEKWIRVCGVKGSNGERPIVDGENAVAREGLSYTSADYNRIQETRSIIMIDRPSTGDFDTSFPSYIQIDGLELRGAHPRNTFTNSFGEVQNYVEFGACIWVNRGQNITIADNEIHDCTNGIFSRTISDGSAAEGEVTRSLRVAGNYIHGNGVDGSYTIHNTYIQTVGVVYEFNRYGPLREGAAGTGLKDRSVGTIIRFNHLEGGAYGVDLVEAEDYGPLAQSLPEYRTSYVYGNRIVKNGADGSFTHYGGDHQGSEDNFRKGDLYFFHNTVRILDDQGWFFRISTTEEHVHAWNNVFWFNTDGWLRMNQEVDSPYTSAGIITLGKNFFRSGWDDADPYHTNPGTVSGAELAINGTTSPIDLDTYVPLTGSAIIGAVQENMAEVAHLPLDYQLGSNYEPLPRLAATTMGAVECCYYNCPSNTVKCPDTPLVSPSGQFSPTYQGGPNTPGSAPTAAPGSSVTASSNQVTFHAVLVTLLAIIVAF